MKNYKVFFKINISFPRGRINSKRGDCQVQSELSKEEMLVDEELKQYVGVNVQKQLKTGIIFSVEITDIQPLSKPIK